MTVKLTKKHGYAAYVRCGLDHSGNDRLTLNSPGWYECCGCGHFFDERSVAECQQGPVQGQKGAGGMYKTEQP